MTDHLFVAFNYSLIINKVRCDAKQESVIQDAGHGLHNYSSQSVQHYSMVY